MKKILHLVFQTHWDREWYFTFERFRYRLTHVIKRALEALDKDEIAYFVLDGQTLPLEDYLEVCDVDDRKKILKYIKEGRMIIGPWFIAMDEFLVHGESIIRNLELGHEIAKTYGNVQKVGYLPDTFGHIGQMPQILKGFSIDNAFMWRGIALERSEFIWEGADDSKLFSIYLVEGYYQPLINQDDRVEATKQYLEKIRHFAQTEDMLLTAGGDHLMPVEKSLNEAIHEINQSLTDVELRVTSYEIYANTLKEKLKSKELTHIKGELRHNERAYILPNVLSTRSYLKQLNQTLEDQVIGYIEPMMALAYFQQKKAPLAYLKKIWRTILENQPHDSICGCSIDMVHLENEMRGLKAKEMIDALQEGLLKELKLLTMSYYESGQKKIDQEDRQLSIYNPHPFKYSGIVEGVLWLTKDQDPQTIMLKDEKKRLVNVQIEAVEPHRLFVSPLDYPPVFRHGKAYHIKARVKELKPLSFTRFEVIEGKSFIPVQGVDDTLENKNIKLKLNKDATLTLYDKRTNQTFEGWHQFYASLDAGDSYSYSKPDEDRLSYAILEGEPVKKASKLSQSMTYRLVLTQPEALDASRKKASDNLVNTMIEVTLTLHETNDFIDVKTTIDQKGKDQRLRLKFPLQVTLDHHTCDSAFELVERKSNRIESFEATRLKEVPVVVDSTLSFVHGTKGDRGIRFYHLGMHESQVVGEDQGSTLEMTLIRSVSHLSRDDFKSRGGAAGPNLATPDAQCIRKHTFHYAFGPATDKEDVVVYYQESQKFRKPPVFTRGYGDSKKSLITKSDDGIQMTSLRWVDKYQVELRLWNPYHEVKDIQLESDYRMKEIKEISLDRRIISQREAKMTMRPNEIKTLLLTYKSR